MNKYLNNNKAGYENIYYLYYILFILLFIYK